MPFLFQEMCILELESIYTPYNALFFIVNLLFTRQP